MDKKLTLSLDQHIVEKAKHFAKYNNTSLSKMIEAYFNSLTNVKDENNIPVTPLVKSLTGIIKLPADFDYPSERTKHLMKKYQ